MNSIEELLHKEFKNLVPYEELSATEIISIKLALISFLQQYLYPDPKEHEMEHIHNETIKQLIQKIRNG